MSLEIVPAPIDEEVLRSYARDALKVLDGNIRLYRRGEKECYRAAAVELRLLLCDTARVHNRVTDISLVLRLRGEVKLHPFAERAGASRDSLSGNNLFDRTRSPLTLAEWLAQVLPQDGSRPPITLRSLIRLVVDQDGGAHVDPKPNSPLRGWPDRDAWIVAVGEYVSETLRIA